MDKRSSRAIAASGDSHDHFGSENLNLLQQQCTCSSLLHKLHEMFDLSCHYMVKQSFDVFLYDGYVAAPSLNMI